MNRLIAFAMVFAAVPALGQDFEAVLSGKSAPLSMALKDLSGDWKRISIQSRDSAGGGLGDIMGPIMQAAMMSEAGKGGKQMGQEDMMGMMFMNSMFGGGDSGGPVYYTKGQTLNVAGESFLVTYKLKKTQPNLMELAMQAGAAGAKEPDMAKMMAGSKVTGDTLLTLSLMNVRGIGTIGDIKPFDLAKEIEDANKGGSMMDLFMNQSTGKSAQPSPVQKAIPAKKKPGTR